MVERCHISLLAQDCEPNEIDIAIRWWRHQPCVPGERMPEPLCGCSSPRATDAGVGVYDLETTCQNPEWRARHSSEREASSYRAGRSGRRLVRSPCLAVGPASTAPPNAVFSSTHPPHCDSRATPPWMLIRSDDHRNGRHHIEQSPQIAFE